jgi:hypothetical protein
MTNSQREQVAAALAHFEQSDDLMLLHRLVSEIAPRARKAVAALIAANGDDGVPPPAELRAARVAAPPAEALKILRATNDFSLLQVLARAIGRRVEDLETVASAEFAEGARVAVPEKVAYPPASNAAYAQGVVERTGTWLAVRLDNGETWEGPPSLARKGALS